MIECLRFNPVNKHTCLGFADVKVSKWGFVINSIALHSKDGKVWVSLPSRQYEKDGVKKWSPYMKMEKPEHQREFLRQIQDAIVAKKNSVVPEKKIEDDFLNFGDF